jgi:hypothetical protein
MAQFMRHVLGPIGREPMKVIVDTRNVRGERAFQLDGARALPRFLPEGTNLEFFTAPPGRETAVSLSGWVGCTPRRTHPGSLPAATSTEDFRTICPAFFGFFVRAKQIT